MNISDLNAILKVATSSPNEAKALVKLLTTDVLKSLGDENYLLGFNDKNRTPIEVKNSSNKPLQEGMKLWSQLQHKSNQETFLQSFVKFPTVVEKLSILQDNFKFEKILDILSSKNPEQSMKQNIMEQMAQATSKEQFSSLTQMLLSLNHGVITIPIYYENYYALLQTKKRYNKESKKVSLDFYAAFELLGPLEGTVNLIEDSIYINIDVEFEQTEKKLRNAVDQLPYSLTINLKSNIEPLFNQEQLNLLDISI